MRRKGRLKAAVIGLGNIGIGYDAAAWKGKNVFSHSKAYSLSPGFELVCGVDASSDMRARFTRLTGKPAYKSLADCGGESIDIVSICTPTSTHAKTVADSLASLNPNFLICEKPISDNEKDGRAILVATARRKVGLAVNYIRRWQPSTHELAHLLKSGALGNISSVHCYYSRGVLNSASHAIDLLCFWFGSPRKTTAVASERSVLARDINAVFALTFADFSAVFQYGPERADPLFEIDIVTDKARVRYSDERQFVRWRDASKPITELKNEMGRYQLLVMDGISKSIGAGTSFVSDGKSAAAVMKICLEVISKCKNSR